MSAANEGMSLRFVVSLGGRVSARHDDGTPMTDDETSVAIEHHLDNVMEELLQLDALDPTIGLDADTVEFSVMIEAINPVDAVNRASSTLRTAIHAAGGGTPDWPKVSDEVWGVWLVSVRTDAVLSSDDCDSDNSLAFA